jgi:ElaA protein
MPAQPSSLHWSLHPLTGLPPEWLYQALRLRVDVFVVEQGCAYPELDGKDLHPAARHLLGHDAANTLLAYCRLLPPGVSFDTPSIGRVVVAPAARRRGIADRLMHEALTHCAALWPAQPLMIAAQQHLLGFYRKHGFAVVSDMYIEDGIAHVDMRRDCER